MRKHAETFHATNWLQIGLATNGQLFLCQLRCFQNRYLWYTFQTLIARKRGLAHFAHEAYFLYENESLQHCLSYDSRQMTKFSVRKARFFSRGPLFMGPFFLACRVRFRIRRLEDALEKLFGNDFLRGMKSIESSFSLYMVTILTRKNSVLFNSVQEQLLGCF